MINPVFILFAIVILAFAGRLLFKWFLLRRKITHIVNTPTSQIRHLLDGRFKRETMVEVKGTLTTDEPLTAPYTKRDCVFFHSQEIDKIERIEYRRTGKGSKKNRSIVYNTTSERKSYQKFYIEDFTGRIEVCPASFEIEGKKVLDREIPREGASSGFWGTLFKPCGDKIIADITRESILPLHQKAYIIGHYYIGNEGPYIGGCPDKAKTSLISVQTEDEIVKQLSRKSYLYLLGFLLLASVAGFLITNMFIL
ncbi:MAG: GIDE domain-containing protein [Pusillimonas sp.]